jgi:cytochrome b subunit of formate dehydrogenase
VDDFEMSIHGRQGPGAEDWLVGCEGCHGPIHDLLPASDPESWVAPTRLPETCGSCHADPAMAERYVFNLVQPIEAYTASVHARVLSEGEHGATCSDCHGSHAIFPAVDPRSDVNHQRVPQTCGECHEAITEEYLDSVHGLAAEHGIRESPVCTDCHGEHRILDPHHEDSPVYATNIPKMTCGRCHEDLHISEKFGLAEDKVPTYADSYHGLAVRSGRTTVANCASCHGVHDILPSSNPESHTHADNLAETCGVCHPGAGQRFAIGPVHISAEEPEHAAVYWVRFAYLWLIGLTIGGMVLHNTLDLFRKTRNPPPRPEALDPAAPERLSLEFRLAHGLLAVSFIVLVYTGFALKYPESWWAVPLLQWEDSLGLRGWVHRVAAVVMLGAAALHAAHLIRSRRARACIAAMRPTVHDLTEFKERIRYFFGKREHPPEAEWVGYPEKMEYLAVIWGTILMAVTGFLLWFETAALRWLPTWALDMATAIHFYEAVLASLAIVVWHFYAVIFDPVVYPLDMAWLTGRSAPGRQIERKPPAYRESAKEDRLSASKLT